MILENFSVENWSCIRRVAVENLPATGVVVLHGPNGTGKTSIVAALRAALMDFAPASANKGLTRWFPAEGEPPRVTVGFRVGAIGYRLTKQFKKNGECRLEKQSAGGWELLTKTPAEVHDEAKRLAGGTESTQGLYQLLWLDQAQFTLPNQKDFDPDVQANLRRVLGVMQTPLDDAFIIRVREKREQWYGARGKSGEPPKLKPKCRLSENLSRLAKYREELAAHEARHTQMRQSLQRAESLERQLAEFERSLATQTDAVTSLREEAERGHARRAAFEAAQHRVTAAAATLATAKKALDDRDNLARKLAAAQETEVTAQTAAFAATERLAAAQAELNRLRNAGTERKNALHAARDRLTDAERRERRGKLDENSNNLASTIGNAERIAQDLKDESDRAAAEPSPTEKELKDLQNQRAALEKLRADVDAAAMLLVIVQGGESGQLAVDGGPKAAVAPGRIEHRVRRRAELTIPGWGEVTLQRGADGRDLDAVIAELNGLEGKIALGIAPFAVPPADADPLTTLQQRVADRKARKPFIKKMEADLKSVAPDGIPALHEALTRIANEKRTLSDAPATSDATDVAAERANVNKCQNQVDAAEVEVDDTREGIDKPDTGLRAAAQLADQAEITASTTVKILTDQLNRMPSAADAQQAVDDAEKEVADANLALKDAALTEEEETVADRLKLGIASADGLTDQRDVAKGEFRELRGSLSAFAGLHQDRADAAARVEILTHDAEREQLEAKAYDRLHQLFEECREKRLQAVVDPITNRVGRWMQLAGIGGYRGFVCNDQFLPDRLTGRDGVAGLPLEQESTGTYEQIALMVRLALGTVLAAPGEPAVAVLDDPLTHSDALRLERMRAVLRSAAKGDGESTPPAAALQILVFTCHPEWFNADAARSIDLGNPAVLQRTIAP